MTDHDIYENQRRANFFGFSGDYLLVTDRCRFSNLDGTQGSNTFEEMIPAAHDLRGYNWEIDTSPNCDRR